MTSALFKLNTFEGPLDLLLQLISKHKLNIYDIEITVLLEQYLTYIDDLEYEDYEDAADFLEMAARLIYIKTCSLLPQDEEAEELKNELQGRIIEYSLCKMAAKRLKQEYIGGEIFVRDPVKLPVDKTYTGERPPESLLEAYLGLSEKSRNNKPLKADMFEPIVSRKIVSVTSKIIYILKKLHFGGEFDMNRLYDGLTDKSEQIATFLAVLELTKSGRIFLNDDNSKIFMNKASENRRIKSDFDVENASNTDAKIIRSDKAARLEEAVPLEHLSKNEKNISEVQTEFESDKSIKKEKKHFSLAERNAAVQCMAEISMKTDEISVVSEQRDDFVSDEIFSAEISEFETELKYSEQLSDISEFESEQEISDKISDNTLNACPAEALTELELISSLSLEPPVTVFKPNYWLSAQYHWGSSPVGDFMTGNCWKYGLIRK